ncbi:LytR/AlgR family response regulator transcription factor [Dyadobacter sediminis]|uniref:Response regulator transcription factor n=1 Tax=Dyadobacter sediminis TaxID=1493691 RepID=A0A5R9KRC8_9BACT|nr:LytTR family DNA-binding domain-containing protein [Dyadobacter sediminis]TLU98689.1 response regulator transcription factor [Dyadobacter sediminis]GGC14414.1 DNA-binding response regulator [Dyadobacter sediminis]
MKCIAIDDEPLALNILRNYIAEFPALELLQTFDDAVEGALYLKTHAVDLLFIDIHMPDLSGLEIVSRLENRPMVIFTTAHKNFAHEGFELEAIDYLLKPIGFQRFEKAVNKALEQFQYRNSRQTQENEAIVVRSEYKMVKIDLKDIEYIEGMEDYIKIHLLNARHPVLTLMSLKEILEILPQNRFSRIHRSYIVPDVLVKSIQNRKVRLTTERELPLSDSYLDFIRKWKSH